MTNVKINERKSGSSTRCFTVEVSSKSSFICREQTLQTEIVFKVNEKSEEISVLKRGKTEPII